MVSPVPIGGMMSPGSFGSVPNTACAGVAPNSPWNAVRLESKTQGNTRIQLDWYSCPMVVRTALKLFLRSWC